MPEQPTLSPEYLLALIQAHETRIRALESGPVTAPQPLRITRNTVDGNTATIEWAADPNRTADSFEVMRDGTDINGTGPWSEIIDDYRYTFRNLKPATKYQLSVRVIYTDAFKDGTAVTITTPPAPTNPPNPTTPPTPPKTRRIPLTGKSGLGYNTLLFQGGTANLLRMATFAKRRGNVPVDGGLTFVPRDSWASLKNDQYIDDARRIIDDGGIVVFSIPHAPESEGDQMNARGAANLYAFQQTTLGRAYTNAGLNTDRFVIRLDWEFNGSWYKWSANRGGGPANLKASIRNAVTNLRAGGLTNARFNLCANGDKTQSGANLADVFPGPEYIDVVGVDQYDQWPPTRTQAEWDTKIRRTEGIQTVIDFARRHGIMWSIDEAGNTHGTGPAYGGDNPAFYRFLYATVRANAHDCAWVTTYDHTGAPATLKHDFTSNPNSWAEYLKQMQIKA